MRGSRVPIMLRLTLYPLLTLGVLLLLLWLYAIQQADTSLFWRRTLGTFEQVRHPGYSTCTRCWRPWATVEGHRTMYTEQHGLFPLCEWCWHTLGSPHERLPYYLALVAQWEHTSGHQHPDALSWEEVRRQVQAAVLRGE